MTTPIQEKKLDWAEDQIKEIFREKVNKGFYGKVVFTFDKGEVESLEITEKRRAPRLDRVS